MKNLYSIPNLKLIYFIIDLYRSEFKFNLDDSIVGTFKSFVDKLEQQA